MAGQVNPALMRALMQRMGMGAGPEGEVGMDLNTGMMPGMMAGGPQGMYRGEAPGAMQMPPREVMDVEALNMGEGGVPGMDLRGMSPALLQASERRKSIAKGDGKKKDSKKKG